MTIKLKPTHFIILGVILGLGGFFLLLANPFGWPTPKPFLKTSTTPTSQVSTPQGTKVAPTPVLILPKGKQTYFVRGGETDVSRITQVTVDPLNVVKGEKQTLTMVMDSKEPVTTTTVTLYTDTSTQNYPMKLTAGTASKGTWEASYTVADTTFTIYNYVFEIITDSGKKTATTFPIR